MSDSMENQDEEKNKLSLKSPHRLVLKKTTEEGSIKQSFAHGRSKSVVVEVRRKKSFAKEDEESHGLTTAKREEKEAALQEALKREGALQSANKPKHQVLRPMSDEERELFQRQEEEKRIRDEERLKLQREKEAREKAAKENEAREAEERARRLQEAQAAQHGEKDDQEAPPAPEKQAVVAIAQDEKPVIVEAREEKVESVEKTEPPKVVAKKQEPVEKPAPMVKPPRDGAVGKPRTEAVSGNRNVGQPARQASPDRPSGPRMTAPPPPPGQGRSDVVGRSSRPGQDGNRFASRSNRGGPVTAPAAAVTPPAPVVEVPVAPVVEAGKEGTAAEKGAPRKKLTRAQREEVARKKVEDLVTLRLAQLEEMREQKRKDDVKRLGEVEGEKPRKAAKPKVAIRGKDDVVDDTQEVAASPRHSRGYRPKARRVEPQVVLGPVVREVVVPETITVSELANRMAVKSSEVIKLLFKQGMMVTINQVLDQDTAVLLVEELGHKPKAVSEEASIIAELTDSIDIAGTLVFRPPVVTVMGHVDHGKTSLLDAIRRTDIASREFGGITQHIGAYQVTLASGARITFLDTPGHAAFTAMRARGAKATDVVVLVVAADDGVMPQTVEALNHAREAKVPIVVAVNKIDKPSANPDRVMQQLSDMELVPEAWGGETIFVPVSAKTGEGLETLQEMILLQSEVLDLRANPDKMARGVIIEAKLDRGRGAVATCLVQNGTLRVGDIFVVGTEWGKIRGLLNDKGESVQEASPAMPVEIIGLSGVPHAGIELIVVPDERRARDIAAFYNRKQKEKAQVQQAAHSNLGDIFTQIRQGEISEIRVVLKGDVQGSVEAVSDALLKISHPEVRVVVIHTGVGGITESDVMLAVASDAIVIGFNVRADVKARTLAKQEGIDLRFYNVIYNVVDELTLAMEGKLRPTITENILGHALVKEVFRISKVGNVAGCVVSDGVLQRQAKVRVLRDHVVMFEGGVTTLRHYKDDLKEAKEGMECGVGLERFADFRPRDILEFYLLAEVKQTIS